MKRTREEAGFDIKGSDVKQPETKKTKQEKQSESKKFYGSALVGAAYSGAYAAAGASLFASAVNAIVPAAVIYGGAKLVKTAKDYLNKPTASSEAAKDLQSVVETLNPENSKEAEVTPVEAAKVSNEKDVEVTPVEAAVVVEISQPKPITPSFTEVTSSDSKEEAKVSNGKDAEVTRSSRARHLSRKKKG